MIDIVYANAYAEVLEILKHVSNEDYNKIPKEKIELFEKNANLNYDFSYDINKTLDEQNVSKKAKTIIAILFRDYWATDAQRKKIKAKEQYDRRMKEEENRKKYNPDNLFKKKEVEETLVNEEKNLIVYEQVTWYNKIFYFFNNIIKKVFKR